MSIREIKAKHVYVRDYYTEVAFPRPLPRFSHFCIFVLVLWKNYRSESQSLLASRICSKSNGKSNYLSVCSSKSIKQNSGSEAKLYVSLDIFNVPKTSKWTLVGHLVGKSDNRWTIQETEWRSMDDT